MGTRINPGNLNPNTFTVETKGTCFICLKLRENAHVSNGVSPHSFKTLARYLDVEHQRIFNISVPIMNKGLEDAEMLVTLCNACSSEANKLSKLFQELEAVIMKTDDCIRTMHRLMLEADRNPVLVQQYQNRITTSNPSELIQASIAQNFRNELKNKCIINSTLATISKTSFKKGKPVPSLWQVGSPSAQISKLPQPPLLRKRSLPPPPFPLSSKKNSPKAKATVDFVDLDLEDSNSNENSNAPELVISSVTGANGSSYNNEPSATTDKDSSTSSSQSPSFTDADSFLESLFAPPPPSCTSRLKASSDLWFNVGDGRLLQCKVCGKMLQMGNVENIENHERIHSGDKPIKCVYCPQRFRNNWTLRFHFISNHRAELLLKFKVDSVSAEDFKRLVDHVIQEDCLRGQDENGGKTYTCTHCHKTIRQKNDLEGHLIQYHFDNVGQKLQELQKNPHLMNQVVCPPLTTSTPLVPNIAASSTSSTEIVPYPQRLPIPSSSSRVPVLPLPSGVSLTPVGNVPIKNFIFPATRTRTTIGGPSKTAFKCNLCGKFFSGFSFLRKHKILVHNAIPQPNPGAPAVGGLASTSTTSRMGANAMANITATSNRAQNSISARVDPNQQRFWCSHCQNTFKFYSTHRIHLLTVHRFEVLSKYLEAGTTVEEVNEVMNSLLKEWIPSGSHCQCKYCSLQFSPKQVELSQLRNHMLLAHFDELIESLKRGIAQRKSNLMVKDNPVQENLRSEVVIVPKEEEQDEDIIEILPD